ncbi:MAG: hypothetical protein KF819_03585 [Labilithrix sp.]|nr:hypothetical protein [Labilithrix sp.]
MRFVPLAVFVCAACVTVTQAARAEQGAESEEELLRQIDAQRGKAVGPPPARAGGLMVFAVIGLATGKVRFDDDLHGDLTGAELLFGGGYRWAVTPIVDMRVATTIAFTFPNAKPRGTELGLDASGNQVIVDRLGAEPSMTTLGGELVARTHFTRESHFFAGLGPRLGARLSSTDVRSTSRSNPSGASAVSTTRRTDFVGQGLVELGAEIGAGRHFELTLRFAAGVASSGADLFGFGLGAGVVF